MVWMVDVGVDKFCDEVVFAFEKAKGCIYKGSWIIFFDDHIDVLSRGMLEAAYVMVLNGERERERER